MTTHSTNKAVEYALNEDAYEAWRPALMAFYRADCWFQSAENLQRGCELSAQDRRLIEVLAKAFAAAPREALRIAA